MTNHTESDNKPTIFMVEDEKSVLSANRRILSRRGYQVEQADCMADALTYLENHVPDLLILDILLPDGNGCDICRKFRQKSDNPVLFLTGKNDVMDKVEGLSLGADYYLTKPYQFEEMLAVVKRLLERQKKEQTRQSPAAVLKAGGLELDLQNSSVTLNGENIQLTGKEFGLLLLFMQNAGKEFSCAELYERVWNAQAGQDTRTVRKHIMNLRSKIRAGETDDYDIVTAYGRGYLFENGTL